MRNFSLILFLAATMTAQTVERPVRGVTDPGVVTTRQTITPAGVPTVFQGRVYGAAFGETGDDLWVLGAGQVYHMDWKQNRVVARAATGGSSGLQGIRYDAAAKTVYAAGLRKGKVVLMAMRGSELSVVADDLGTYNAGAIAVGAGKALVPVIANNKLAIIDLATGKLEGYAATGIAPFAAVISADGKTTWVSNWGGRLPKAGDLTAPTGLDAKADRVVVDARGIASTGTVTRIDLATRQATDTVATGLHPTGLVWDEKRGRLYVANANDDSVSVVNTATMQVAATIPIQPFATKAKGLAPTAVALTADGAKLFVALGGVNAVAQVDTATLAVQGLLPAAWYPNGLAVSPDGKRLAITALLGAGSGWQNEPARRFVHANRGAVSVVDLPDSAQLASYTRAVAENNHLELKGAPPVVVARNTAPRAIPLRAGEPTPIEHVVYIIKENRTYDQLFGDLTKGNGEPKFVMFGESVTPNHRRLADQFVLLDNFYATGGNSADGHQWVTQANEVAYAMWPGYQGRSYPFDGTDPIAYSSSGFLWDYALSNKKSVRIYGEYAGRLPEPRELRLELLEGWRKGEDYSTRWNIKAPIEPLNKLLAANFPSYTNSIPDVVRAQIFLKDVAAWEKAGTMPNLVLLQLPSDHTFGTAAGASTPKAMVADNDLALGRVVEGLSKSKFWPKMAIFVVEDDAQNGVDHVDGHRTVALAISPYIRRGHVDSTFYSHQSMLKTIELILGLPAMTIFDLIANDMRASFTDTPDLRPYEAVAPQQDLFEVNPPVRALQGAARRAAVESAKMRWDVPDAISFDRLNRILWGYAKGWGTPYPGTRRAVFAPLGLESEDDEE